MERKKLTTTFRKDLFVGIKKLAVELDCNANEILEVAYQYLIYELSKSDIENKLKEYKEDK